MARHSLSEWVVATRPWSFPASIAPILTTTAFLYYEGHEIDWWMAAWAVVSIVLFHAAGNTWSDYFDFRKRVDAADTYGSKTLTSGQFAPREILALSTGLLLAATVSGLGLMLAACWEVAVVGALGALFTVLYPYLKYRSLGDLCIYINYAVLPSIGTAYVLCGEFRWAPLAVVIPVGLITVGILHANNTRDMATDARADIRTLAMVLGLKGSGVVYGLEVYVPYVLTFVFCLLGMFPWTAMLLLLTWPMVSRNAREMNDYTRGKGDIALLDTKTAQLQLVTTLILSSALIISRLCDFSFTEWSVL